MVSSIRLSESESWRVASLRSSSMRMFQRNDSIFVSPVSSRRSNDDDEEDLKWAALEKLPTYDRLTISLLMLEQTKSGHIFHDQVDVRNISLQARQQLLDRLIRTPDQDNELLMLKLRERIDRYREMNISCVCDGNLDFFG